MLGGPGSGKTWLARRTARLCAETALEQLAAGAELQEVELPLYTTCARLSAVPLGEGIRRAIVSGALAQLPDLGGTRIDDALRVLFEERNAPTLLVADSLDETHGADDRIRQADSLPQTWRIILTSRPASWNRQLAIGDDDPSRRVGVLRPLRYPSDVDPFVAAWFSGRPLWAEDLTAQVRNRPALQQAATVPLILAFYCIVGGDQPLPGRRAELYAKVIRRMLTGRWHGSGDRDPDVDECMETLRGWAWSAAASNPVSGVGTWVDEFPTPRVRHGSQADQDALDHVAVPLGPPDPDTGMAQRRFVHRSLQEHLVAEHLALRMSVDEAARELLNHVWYDPDWEYAAPAALAMHPQRDQILKELIRRITRAEALPVDLAAIDDCWEIRRFLARVAQESDEADWPTEAAEMIGQARLDLATSRSSNLRQVVVTSNWPTSSRLILEPLLGLLATKAYRWIAEELVDAVTRLVVTAEDRARAREALLALLARETRPERFRQLADAVTGLAVTEEDRARAREALLALLARETRPERARWLADVAAGLNPTREDRGRAQESLLGLLAPEFDPGKAPEALLGLLAPEFDPGKAPEALLGLLAPEFDPGKAPEALLGLFARELDPLMAQVLANAVTRLLDPTAGTREALLGLLARVAHPSGALRLTYVLTQLNPTAGDQARAREALLGLLAHEDDSSRARQLAGAVIRLAMTEEDRARAREALIGLLAREANSLVAKELIDAITRLDPTAEDRARAREALLGLLAREAHPSGARRLAGVVTQLNPTAGDRARVREALLGLLAREANSLVAKELIDAITRLDPTAGDRARVREALLGLLAREANSRVAKELIDAITRLDPTAEDRARAREALLGLLARNANSRVAKELTDAITRLAVTAEDRAQAREALLGLLAHEGHRRIAEELAEAVAGLDPSAEDRAQAREALLGLLAHEDDPSRARRLAGAVAGLAVTAEDRERAREALLGLLAHEASSWVAKELADAVTGLDPTAEDRARAREALLGLLAREDDPSRAQQLAEASTGLSPTVADLVGSSTWPFPPTPALLAAVRQNSGLPAWLAALSSIIGSARTAAESDSSPTMPNNG